MHLFGAKPGYTGLRRVFLSLAGVMLAGSVALSAQTVIGAWQGTLPGGENSKVVLKITKGDDGGLRGAIDWMDRYQNPIPLSSASFTAPSLSVASVYIQTSYQATLSADGRSLTGAWVQGQKTYPLTLVLTPPEKVWKRETVAPLAMMSTTVDPAFEVATIKPSVPGQTQRSFNLRTRQFAAKNSTVGDLIRFAYGVRTRQIEGAPNWLDGPRFDIAAEPDAEGLPSVDQYRTMLKKLLADRYQLKLHSVQRMFPVYALTLEKVHPKVSQSESGVNLSGRIITGEQDGQALANFQNESMVEFADILMNFIPERQIVDETGLTGRFDFLLTMPMSVLQSSDDNEKATGFFEALKPLGFKLVPEREPIEVLVVERLEKPTAN